VADREGDAEAGAGGAEEDLWSNHPTPGRLNQALQEVTIKPLRGRVRRHSTRLRASAAASRRTRPTSSADTRHHSSCCRHQSAARLLLPVTDEARNRKSRSASLLSAGGPSRPAPGAHRNGDYPNCQSNPPIGKAAMFGLEWGRQLRSPTCLGFEVPTGSAHLDAPRLTS